MAVDVLVLNTAVADFRREDFDFTDALVGRGGLAKCSAEKAPPYSQRQLHDWIEQGCATAGGPGNTAPLMAKAGLKVALGVNLGKGDFGGLDAQGRFVYDVMAANGIDMSGTFIHPGLPTGTTYIHQTCGGERGGIAYFPGANDDFDFGIHKKSVERLSPRIVYYMYSGLSDRGDADGGKDLAEFIKWCRSKGTITIADSHTLTGDPAGLIKSGKPVPEYRLLEPLLPELDLFFTSSDEAKMIENTLKGARNWDGIDEQGGIPGFLEFLCGRFWKKQGRTRVFGVTVSNGAYEKHIRPDGVTDGPNRIESRFMAGEVVDLVGAGDSFRAGLLTYIARNLDQFRDGSMNFAEAVQMGNLFASLYIKSPLGDRYRSRNYEKMLKVVRSRRDFQSFEAMQKALS
jgi:sugar/nucleoside kinase (ribokinase family)